jgi:hypothetical protein
MAEMSTAEQPIPSVANGDRAESPTAPPPPVSSSKEPVLTSAPGPNALPQSAADPSLNKAVDNVLYSDVSSRMRSRRS